MERPDFSTVSIFSPTYIPSPSMAHASASEPNHLSENADSDFEEHDLTNSTSNSAETKSISLCSTSKLDEWNKSSSKESFHTIKTVQGEKQRYWKLNFLLVLSPLILCGFPIHLLLWGRRGISNWKQWFKQIFLKDPIPIRLLTMVFFLIGLGINGFFIAVSTRSFHSLVIKGEVRFNVLEDVLNILRLAPMVIPLNFVWIWGYSVRKLLLSFDRVTYPEIEVMDKSEMNKKWKHGWRSMPSYRFRLFLVYLLILLNQSISLLIVWERSKAWAEDDLDNTINMIDAWVDFILGLMYNLMLPLYMCLTWGIQFEFERLSLYIKSLIACRVHPSFTYFAQFKKYYKDVGNHVMLVNDICGFYYSWVLLVLYSSMYDEVFGVLIVLFGIFIASGLGWRSDASGESDMTAVDVRLFVGNFFGGLTQMVILGLTVWFCITANDQARNLHVRLNDFISESYVVLSPELYKKVPFCILNCD